MAVTPEASRAVATRASLRDTFAVYLKRRVLIVLFLGFSSGLPLALSGSTLLVWMTEAGVNLGTIGLFALVGTPYTIKFLWAPLIDALDVPVLSRRFGRRRGWPDTGRPHNLAMVMSGLALLWFGWLGFNGGSVVANAAAQLWRLGERRKQPDRGSGVSWI